MDSGEHNLFISTLHKALNLCQHSAWIHAAAAAADRRNDAKGTIRIAAVLNRHNRTRPTGGPRMRTRLQIALEENIAAEDFGTATRIAIVIEHVEREPADERLMGIANDILNARQACDLFRSTLGVAACDDDSSFRISRSDSPDQVSGIPIGFFRDGAGVDDNDVRVKS